ncbi:MAG: DNA polymerase III subunit beta, partial [Chloroflexi bacterium]|nr:DNA polymerase III subunit beta [Chloroflexota bacterium]
MQASVLSENLARALTIVGRAVPPRTTLPTPGVGSVHIETAADYLVVRGTNLDIGIRYKVGAQVAEAGSVAVPAKLLADFCGALPPDRLDLTTKKDTLCLACGPYQANIKGMDPGEFPAFSKAAGAAFEFDVDQLHQAIGRVTMAAASDESRPILTGVLCEVNEGQMTLSAADGFRLSIATLSVPYDGTHTAIIPARAFDELARVTNGAETVSVILGQDHVSFTTPQVELTARLIEGAYPNVKSIIPADSQRWVRLNVADMVQAAQLAGLFTDSDRAIWIAIEPAGRLVVTSRSDASGNQQSEMEAVVDGMTAGMQVGLNAKFFLQLLKAMGGQAELDWQPDSQAPSVFRPADGNGFTHVIMPMQMAG